MNSFRNAVDEAAGRRVRAIAVSPSAGIAEPAASLRQRREHALALLRRIRGEESGGAAAVIAKSSMRQLESLLHCPYSGRTGSLVIEISHTAADGGLTIAKITAAIDTGGH